MNKLKALVIDNSGNNIETAVRFMRDCTSVKFATYAGSEMGGLIGRNLDGIERVDDPIAHIDDADFIFCPDVGSGEMVEFLKKHDYPVAGAGSVERLETDRKYARQYQAKSGLPLQHTVFVKGVTELRKFCQGNKNYFIKVDNEWRDVSESFLHTDYKNSEPRIDYISFKTGPYKEDVLFVCEDVLSGVEPGTDGITFDGELVFPTMAGYEVGKKSYLARVYKAPDDFPDAFWQIHDGLSDEFKKRKTRFFYSAEFIIKPNGKPYLLDPTMRMASPGGVSLQTELIDNFTDVCYDLATGKIPKPVFKYKYGIAVPLETPESLKTFVNVAFPDELRQWVKFFHVCKKGQDYYSIPTTPPDPVVCCVVALGNTVEQTIKLVKERIDQVKGNGIKGDESGLSKVEELIAEGKEVGVDF